MGAGKTYLGRQLAEKLDFAFVDLDELIVERAEKSIPDIFAEEGEAAFRALELGCLRSLGESEEMVIACGGGTPCYFDNMDWMLENGTTIFLDTAVDLLYQRLKPEIEKRPLLADKSEDELVLYLEEKIEERLPFYSKASLIIKQENTSSDVLQQIVHFLSAE